MAYLLLRRIDGSTERHELSRSHPLTIGRQKFNDICVSEDEVHPLHCRVTWNKSSFEVTSATTNGIDVNSNTFAHVELKPGDVIRVGTVDLVFEDDTKAVGASDSVKARKSRSKSEPKEDPVEDLSLYDGKVLIEANEFLDDILDASEVDASKPMLMRDTKRPVEMPAKRVRPGEQEIIRSPLLMTLTGGGLLLLLITGIIWFLLGREQAHRLYERAVSESNSGQYTQSIASFEQFLQQYPNHGSRRQASRGLAQAQVLKEISGSAQSWKRGLERLNELIKNHRSEPDFGELQTTLFQFSEDIAVGAAKTAELARDPEMLAISKEAQNLVERYADPATPVAGSIARIVEQQRKAERAIEKQWTFDTAMKAVDDALNLRQPIVAMAERARLVKSFPEYASSKRVRDVHVRALDLERSLVAVDVTERAATTEDDAEPTSSSVLGLLHARSRSDEASQGRLVLVQAKETCHAVDATTGEPVWRRIVGPNPPFFPQLISGVQSSVLMFDTRKQALVACDLATGKLLWRQVLGARAIGRPLIHEEQMYLALDDKTLVRVGVDDGMLTATVTFSQNLATTPALSRSGDYLLVPGDMAMIYSLAMHSKSSQQSLSAAATTFTDHASGSLVAPPLSMGKLLLLCENNFADKATLRLWNANSPEAPLTEIATATISGQVRDTPVLRGNQLVVPSAGEQFSAFVVTDEPGNEGIAPIGQYRADQNQAGKVGYTPVFVILGSDNQFFSASSAFRRFELSGDAIRMDSNSSAPGIASQPLQQFGDYFFVGRKSRVSDAVTFSAIEREKLVNPWRIIVGDAPREMLASREGGVVWVGESGTMYSLGKNRIEAGGVDLKAGTDLDLPNNIQLPIRASVLHDQRLAVFASGETKVIFLINAAGQVTGRYVVNDVLETDPVLLDDGLVLPLPNCLKVLPLTGGKKNLQDWRSPTGNESAKKWTHLIRIDRNELIACDDSGVLMRVQTRQGNAPHLAEVATLQLGQPVDLRPLLHDDLLLAVDAGGTLHQISIHSFDTEGRHQFRAPIRNMWLQGDQILLQAGDRKLHCVSVGKEPSELWEFDLDELDPIGHLCVKDDSMWLGCRDGTILVIDPKTGAEIRRTEVPQSLSLGLRQVNESLIAVAVDGTIYRVE